MRNGGDTEEDIRSRIERGKNVPSMALWGREDKVRKVECIITVRLFLHLSLSLSQICDVAGAKLIKRLAPHSKVVVINNCGHCMSVERPKKCAQFIEQFINQQSLSS